MSISSEITRIQNKRDQSFTEVANKGVTVPAGSTIDDLPGLIAQIEQGSGSGSGGIIYQDLDGYLNLSEDEANVISIVDTLDTAGGTVRTITGKAESEKVWTTNGIADGTEPNGEINITVTSIAAYAFTGKPISSIIASNCTSVGANCFESCTQLKKIVIGGAGHISANFWIRNCPSLVEVRVPNATLFSPNGYGFSGDVSLNLLDIGFSQTLYSSGLPSTAPLSIIIMRRNDALVNLSTGPDSLNSLAFAEGGTGGTIYIPEVLYNHLGDESSLDYKASTNWSTLDARGTVTWAKIEGSEYE